MIPFKHFLSLVSNKAKQIVPHIEIANNINIKCLSLMSKTLVHDPQNPIHSIELTPLCIQMQGSLGHQENRLTAIHPISQKTHTRNNQFCHLD